MMPSKEWQYNQQDDDVNIVLVLISIIVNSYNHVFGYDLRYSFRDEGTLAWLNMHPANCGLNYYVTGIFINGSIFQENPHYKMSIMLDHFYIKMGFLKNNDSACPPEWYQPPILVLGLLHKYKTEQKEVISRPLFSFVTHKLQEHLVRTGPSEHSHFPNTFSYFFHSYDVMSLEKINPIAFWKYTKQPIKVLLKISTQSFKLLRTWNLFIRLLYKAFIKLL